MHRKNGTKTGAASHSKRIEPSKKVSSRDPAGNAVRASKGRKLPPDPDGLFQRAADRAKVIVAMYDALNPFLGSDYLISNILFDLMHLSDRDPSLGGYDEGEGRAHSIYEELVQENREMVRWEKSQGLR